MLRRCFDVYVVVLFCHSSQVIRDKIVMTAQDINMMNGDYAFFAIGNVQGSGALTPWINYGIDDEAELAYRTKASYAVKQVRVAF